MQHIPYMVYVTQSHNSLFLYRHHNWIGRIISFQETRTVHLVFGLPDTLGC